MTALTTPDQIHYYRKQVLIAAIKLYLRSNGRMTAGRGWTPAVMRRMATEYTGMTYRATRNGLENAYHALTTTEN